MCDERTGWLAFARWLREVHPRATAQIRLVEELLHRDPGCSDLQDLEQRLWPLGSGIASDHFFRRNDRFRRVLSDLRRRVVEYNRVHAGHAEHLVLRAAEEQGGLPVLGVSKTINLPDLPDAGQLLGGALLLSRVDQVLALLRVAHRPMTSIELRDVAERLLAPVAGTRFEHGGGPEWCGEEAIRMGCAYEVEVVVRRVLREQIDGLQYWNLFALWAEACDAMGLARRMLPFVESAYRHVCSGESPSDVALTYRLRRLWLRSVARCSSHPADCFPVFEEQIRSAERQGRIEEAFELRILQVQHLIDLAMQLDRPGLIRQAASLVENELAEGTNQRLSPLARNSRQFLHWITRVHSTLAEVDELLESSKPILQWMLENGRLTDAARVYGYHAHVLCIAGSRKRAREASVKSVVLRIRIVDRAGLLFSLRDFASILRHEHRENGAVLQALKTVRDAVHNAVMSSEWQDSLLGADVVLRTSRDLRRTLPEVLASDWERLLLSLPENWFSN